MTEQASMSEPLQLPGDPALATADVEGDALRTREKLQQGGQVQAPERVVEPR
jgi:hypothetical protein